VWAEWSKPPTVADVPSGEEGTALRLPALADGTFASASVEHLADHLETQLLEWLRQRCGVAQDQLDRERPFAELGIDSLSAVELIAELESWSGLQLSSVAAWKYPTPAALARYLARQLGHRATVSPSLESAREVKADGDLERLLNEVEQMSEEDVARAMEDEELAERGDG
jgi:acyl carrier protein